MTRSLVGTIAPEDYSEIQEGMAAVRRSMEFFGGHGVRLDIPHAHRMWEYGSAIQAFLSVYQEQLPHLEVLDVGAGYGALGPALALNYNVQVHECDPEVGILAAREKCNQHLKRANRKPIDARVADAHHLPEREYDAVFCISVIEHVNQESTVWKELARRVKPNGLLFVTCDCVEKHGKPYMYDGQRAHNFTPEDLRHRLEPLQEIGFATMGRPDYSWRGAQVFDYSFFRMGLIKLNGVH